MDDNVITATVEERLAAAQAQIVKYQRMVDDVATDMSVVYAMCEHFITYFTKEHSTYHIRDAVRWAYDDTGISLAYIKEFLARTGLTDPEYCTTEYNVHMTIPVMITIRVDALDEDDAQDVALGELDSNGIDTYNMDYNTYDIDYDVEEV